MSLPRAHASTDATQIQLPTVEVAGHSTMAREKKTLKQLYKAQALFEEYRQLAPSAQLKYRVFERQQEGDLARAELALHGPEGRTPIVLDERHEFVLDPAWQTLDANSEIRSKLAEGRIAWRPDIRTPGLPANVRRLGDLRLQCRVAFDSGLGRSGGLFVGMVRTVLSPLIDQCEQKSSGASNIADTPLFAVTLQHGERRQRLSHRLMHGASGRMRNVAEMGQSFDWGYLLRERTFRLPLGDAAWPDDTLVHLEPLHAPPEPLDQALSQPEHALAQAARAWVLGETIAAQIEAALGKARVDSLESGLQTWLYERDGAELVLLLSEQGLLQKLGFRPAVPKNKKAAG